jgi:hypothetical protein
MQLSMDSGFLVIAGVLFLCAGVGVYLASQRLEDFYSSEQFRKQGESEGAPRSVSYVFYLLIVWACLTFVLPMSIGYYRHLDAKSGDLPQVFLSLLQVFIGPLTALLLLFYGIHRGFIGLFKDTTWPEDKVSDGDSK